MIIVGNVMIRRVTERQQQARIVAVQLSPIHVPTSAEEIYPGTLQGHAKSARRRRRAGRQIGIVRRIAVMSVLAVVRPVDRQKIVVAVVPPQTAGIRRRRQIFTQTTHRAVPYWCQLQPLI